MLTFPVLANSLLVLQGPTLEPLPVRKPLGVCGLSLIGTLTVWAFYHFPSLEISCV